MDKPEGARWRATLRSGVLLAIAALPMLALLACGTATAADFQLPPFASAAANVRPLPASPDTRYQLAGILQQDDFQAGLSAWTIESERPAQVTAIGGVLDIDTPAGLTLWLRSELHGPVLIEYEAEAVSAGGP